MPQPNDLSRSLVALDHNSTIIAVVEMSQSTWLVGGVVPGIERQPRKKLEPRPERPCLAASLARRGGQGRPHNHTDCAGLRSRSRRLLAGALAGGARSRGVRDAPLKCRGVARTSPSQDRPARHRVAETGVLGACPKCHAEQTQAWLEQRREEMLPVPYFHVTVTVPEELRAALRRHQIDGYGALMKAAAAAIIVLARDPRWVGGTVGVLAVLHTCPSCPATCRPAHPTASTATRGGRNLHRHTPLPRRVHQSDAFVQPSLRARKGHANSDSFYPRQRGRS
jgi:Transposase zinc-binding domain